MKTTFTFILLLFILSLHAQNDIVSVWNTNLLFGPEVSDEYRLFKKATEKFEFGNSLSLKPDGNFISDYSAPCGNDCFRTTYGSYKLKNNQYVTFIIDSIVSAGDCRNPVYKPEDNMRTYFIHKNQYGYKLIKSEDDLKTDQAKALSLDIVDSCERNTAAMLKGQDWKCIKAKSDDEIFTEGLKATSQIDPSISKVLLVKGIDRNYYKVFLFEHEGKMDILVYLANNMAVALYDRALSKEL